MGNELIRTGIFSGSFNPIHIGHLALANYLCEFAGLDELWFLVSPCNPLKQGQTLLPDTLRLELVQMAVADYPKFRASDFEFHLPRPSYTVNTLQRLKEIHPCREFHLIIGSDNWQLFPRWYKADTILNENHLLIYPRPGYPVDEATLPPTARLVDSPIMEISSTFIRESLAQGKDIRCFLPAGVYKRLLQSGTYDPERTATAL
ncbi:MAG: nicotinate-nucleotide adenylyltransferase [Mediterranea massiliensis]|nr:nicotinate-nucleotide adenylyltransferase [Mediterranea massiliensis]